MVEVGCNTLIYGGYSLETALQHIAWAGYDGIELAAILNMAEHAALGRDAAYAQRLRAQVEEHGLRILHLGVHAPVTTPRGQERLGPALCLARDLGTPLVLTATGGQPPEGSARDTYAAVEALVGEAAGLGLKLGIKPHVGHVVHGTESALAMIDAVRAPNLGLDWDVSHIYREQEDPAESFRRLAPHVFTVRLRDSHSREPRIGPPETQVPGRGAIDIPGVLRAIRESGYPGDISVDIVGTKEYDAARIMGIVAETRGYLRRCMQEMGY